MRLLEAGINVYTTLNVQHLESLNDVVAQITGISVAETVPDSIFEPADEVELVDLPPDDLLERLREGKVYVPDQAERAIQNFFHQGKPDRAARAGAAQGRRARRRPDGGLSRGARRCRRLAGRSERLLVCVGPSPFRGATGAGHQADRRSLKAPWMAVHVETPADARMSQADRDRLAANAAPGRAIGRRDGDAQRPESGRRADSLRAQPQRHEDHRRQAAPAALEGMAAGSLVYELTRKCGDIDVYVITGDPEQRAAGRSPHGAESPRRRVGYLAERAGGRRPARS